MKYLLFIVALAASCESSTDKIRLTSPGSSSEAEANAPGREVIVVKPAGKTIATDASKPPGNIDTPQEPPPPPPPSITLKDIDAKLPKDASWMAASGGTIPPDTLAGGQFGSTFSYICRALHNGSYLPGLLSEISGLCYIADGTTAIGYASYQALIYPLADVSAAFAAVATTTAEIPRNSIGMGLKDGKVQYLCLVMEQADFIYVGRVDTSTGGCLYVDDFTLKPVLTKSYSAVVSVP